MKTIQLKHIAVAGLVVLGLANHSFAANVAEATGVMADLESLVVQAKANLAKASLESTDAMADPLAQSAEVDKAVEAGREALAAMEQATANGDTEAADAAEAKLAEALLQARNALLGIFSETVAVAEPGDDGEKDYNSPNIYDDPWKSQGIRSYYQSLFEDFQESTTFGQKGYRGSDEDATKE